MNRRHVLAVLTGSTLAAALPAVAQDRRVRKIGFLGGGNAATDAPGLAAFRDGMAALGWAEGRDYLIDARYAENVSSALPDLAAALIATRPDIFLTPSEPPTRALVDKTTIPVVFAIARDPIGAGLAKSLQRPGGTATGLITFALELSAKRLQILHETFPKTSHVVALVAADDPVGPSQVSEVENAARALGIRVTPIALERPSEISKAFAKGVSVKADAYVIGSGPMTSTNRKAIVDAVAHVRAPAIYPFDIFALDGGLMSYGASRSENYRRAAGYVDKILKGAKPGDLAIEQPTQVELLINLKTARAQGFAIPQPVLLRADKVIQ